MARCSSTTTCISGSGSASEELDHTAEAVERYVERPGRGAWTRSASPSTSTTSGETPRVLGCCRTSSSAAGTSLDRYCDAVLEAKRRGPSGEARARGRLGAASAQSELADVLAPYPWDYLLGSVHWIDGLAVDQQPGLWERKHGRGGLGALHRVSSRPRRGADTSTCSRIPTWSRSSATVSSGTGSR